MKPNYSPGPWLVKGNGASPRVPCAIEGEGWTIAELYWNEHMDGDTEVNARLMAAAPELYEALKLALRQLRSWHISTKPASKVDVRVQEAIDLAEAAIRKVEED
jgi:hypothetical protein